MTIPKGTVFKFELTITSDDRAVWLSTSLPEIKGLLLWSLNDIGFKNVEIEPVQIIHPKTEDLDRYV